MKTTTAAVAAVQSAVTLSNITRSARQLLTLSNRKRFYLPASDPADAETSGNYAFTSTRASSLTTFISLILRRKVEFSPSSCFSSLSFKFEFSRTSRKRVHTRVAYRLLSFKHNEKSTGNRNRDFNLTCILVLMISDKLKFVISYFLFPIS